jgi:hypothetical protein
MNEERPEKYLPQVEEEFEDTKGIIRVRILKIIEHPTTVTVKCITAIKALFLYFNLCTREC